MSGSAVGFAAAAAICLALGSALQHQAAAGERGHRTGILLLWRLARNWRWATGLAVAAIGLLLHAIALHSGALAVVQPVLVTSVALALPIREILDRSRPSGWQVLAAIALAAGVAVFVTAANPGAGRAAPSAADAAILIAVAAVLAVLCSVVAARTHSGRAAGFALGLAAGILYGMTGGALKATVQAAVHDPLTALAGWPLWTMIVLGGWGFIVHQRSYTLAPLSVSLPALSVANPLAGMLFGMLVFGEVPADGLPALLGQALGVVVIVASVTVLARSPASGGRHPATPADGSGYRPGGGGQAAHISRL